MKSSVQVMGHPIHPILVTLAIGAIVSAFVFDIAAISTGNVVWYLVSFWVLLVGVIAAVPAAITGMADYFALRMSPEARTTATIHFALNVSWLVLLIVSLVVKAPYAVGGITFGLVPIGVVITGFVLGMVAVVLLLISGWYGGELVYRHGVGVMEEAAEEVRYPQHATAATGTLGGERPEDEPE